MTPPIFVTGGAGFIGSALVRRLIGESGATVVNIDILTYAGNLKSLDEVTGSSSYSFEQIDIRDVAALRRIFSQYQPRTVFHLAAESHVDRSIDGPAAFVETNVVGTYSLLEVAREYWYAAGRPEGFRFIHTSTDEVFGTLGDTGRFDETTQYAPNSPYAASKAAADHLVRAWHQTYDLPVITTNCSNNYGPYQFPEKLIPQMVISAVEENQLPVYGDGGQVRDWLHVDDHVDALLKVASSGRIGHVYAVGGRSELRNIEIVEKICALLDKLQPRANGRTYSNLVTNVPDRPGHDRRYAIDPSKIENELHWRPTRSFDAGLDATVRWYLENESWWRPLRDNEYHGERLGLKP